MWLVAALLDGADKDHSHPCKGFCWTVLAWTQCSLNITDFGTSSSCLRPTMTSTFLEKTKRFHEPQSPCDLALHHLVCFVPHCSPSCSLGYSGRLSVPPLATPTRPPCLCTCCPSNSNSSCRVQLKAPIRRNAFQAPSGSVSRFSRTSLQGTHLTLCSVIT